MLTGETLAIGAAGVLLFFIAKKQFSSEIFALFTSFLFFSYPALHYLNFENYHPDVYVVLFVFMLWYGYLINSLKLFYFSSFLIILVKEQMSLILVCFGLYLYLFKKWKPAKWIVIIGIFFFILLSYVVIPGVNNVKTYSRVDLWASSAFNVFKGNMDFGNFLDNNVITERNKDYLIDLFAPFGFFQIFNPLVIMLNPLFVLNIITDWPYAHSIQYHYTAGIIGTLFISFLEAAYAFNNYILGFFKKRYKNTFRYIKLYMYPILLLVFILYIIPFNQRIEQNTLRFENLFRTEPKIDYKLLDEIKDMQNIVGSESISVSYPLLPFFSSRKEIFMWTNPFKNGYYGVNDSDTYETKPFYILLYRPVIGENDFNLTRSYNYTIINETEKLVLFKSDIIK